MISMRRVSRKHFLQLKATRDTIIQQTQHFYTQYYSFSLRKELTKNWLSTTLGIYYELVDKHWEGWLTMRKLPVPWHDVKQISR